jgi:hypothetical protein
MNPDTGLCRGYGFVEFADDVAALDCKEREEHVFAGHRVSSSWLITAWPWRRQFSSCLPLDVMTARDVEELCCF